MWWLVPFECVHVHVTGYTCPCRALRAHGWPFWREEGVNTRIIVHCSISVQLKATAVCAPQVRLCRPPPKDASPTRKGVRMYWGVVRVHINVLCTRTRLCKH